jgi:hypothetical protein
MSNSISNVSGRTETLHENSFIEGIAVSKGRSCFDLWTRISFNVIVIGYSTSALIFIKIVYIVSIFTVVFKCLFIIISSTVCLCWLCGEHRLRDSELVDILGLYMVCGAIYIHTYIIPSHFLRIY